MQDIGILICFICFLRACYLMGYENGAIDMVKYYESDD